MGGQEIKKLSLSFADKIIDDRNAKVVVLLLSHQS